MLWRAREGQGERCAQRRAAGKEERVRGEGGYGGAQCGEGFKVRARFFNFLIFLDFFSFFDTLKSN